MITRETIEKLLRENFNKRGSVSRNIKFPSGIDAYQDCPTTLIMILNDPSILRNMQEDNTAFEGWMLALKFWLPELKDSQINLQWKKPANCLDPHYQRFLYRVERFRDYFSWMNFDGGMLADSEMNKHQNLFLNAGNRETPINTSAGAFEGLTEHDIEVLYASDGKAQSELVKMLDINRSTIKRQLPVGLFKNKVTVKNNIFTAKKSAIDLWAIGNDGKTLHIFEIKKDNAKVGAITEMFFYAQLLADVQRKRVRILESGIEQMINNTSMIQCHLLTNEPHPLLSHNILSPFITRKDSAISYHCLVYDHDFTLDKKW